MRPRPGQEAAEQPLLQITVAPAGESPATVIKVAGELDESTQDQLITTVGDCLRHHAAPVRLDLAGLTFLGSAGIGALLQCRDAAVQAGHTLELVDPQPSVHHVLDIVNLLPTFGLAPARVAADGSAGTEHARADDAGRGGAPPRRAGHRSAGASRRRTGSPLDRSVRRGHGRWTAHWSGQARRSSASISR